MNPTEQKKAAKAFVEHWKAKEGNEQREANSFWIELCHDVLGISSPTKYLDFERKVKGRRIDVFYEDMGILIENKSRGISLDAPEQRGKDKHGNPRMVTPYEQARWYADHITPRSVAPKWIITSNFDTMRIYDLDDEDCEEHYETLTLDELPGMVHRLSFFTRKENSRMEREKELSVKAGEVVGKLYDAFASAYLDIENSADEQRSLNILITRIVFLLYAEDADLLHERNAFYNYLKNFQVAHMRQALIDLFAALKTPEDGRDPYLAPELSAFPYVNGGLFADDIIIPQFTQDTRFILLQEASADFDWSGISPTIFGAVFESTLNPETRRAGGMHYTSVENIHKLTGPLFYDELKDELTAIEGLKTEKERKFKLNAFRQKIATLKFLDPACGSGNFLTETYLSLRKLENRVLEDLYGGQMVMGVMDPIQVSLDQFYGIEINDFAVEVAKTALWIAELQMLDETREILSMWIDPLPLKSNDNIVCGNALHENWDDVVPASECNYIIGNPPFIGRRYRTQEQIADIAALSPSAKDLDYVGCWYIKAVDYIQGTGIRCALVSTNSITQGEQVSMLWPRLYAKGAHINFAVPTFVWNSEASDQAHVHVVIVGFSLETTEPEINPYLFEGNAVVVSPRRSPLSPDAPAMRNGNVPLDGDCLKVDEADYPQFADCPYLKRLIGGKELLNNGKRWVLWLPGVPPDEIERMPKVLERVNACREARLSMKDKATRKLAETPTTFRDTENPQQWIAAPLVSSERRRYIAMAHLDGDTIPTNQVQTIPNADMYCFGILMSLTHNAWMRVVGGRLKSDYRYGKETVYNTFPWPQANAVQEEEIVRCAEAVLAARNNHPGKSLAQMYDGISPMPENPSKSDLKKYNQHEYDDLKAAHAALDAAVEAAYGVDFGGDEKKIVAHLFKLYAEATGEN